MGVMLFISKTCFIFAPAIEKDGGIAQLVRAHDS